jgi:hypothetical protein
VIAAFLDILSGQRNRRQQACDDQFSEGRWYLPVGLKVRLHLAVPPAVCQHLVRPRAALTRQLQRAPHPKRLAVLTVTVFSTVGFGDITPKTELARLLVTGQMVVDVIILGLAIKVIVGAARSKRSGTPGM